MRSIITITQKKDIHRRGKIMKQKLLEMVQVTVPFYKSPYKLQRGGGGDLLPHMVEGLPLQGSHEGPKGHAKKMCCKLRKY